MKKVLLPNSLPSAYSFLRSINAVLDSSSIRFCTCAFIFFSYLLCFAPGGMSPDSVYQFDQALSGNFHIWHPPVMAVLWRILFFFQQGPLPFLTFHLLMLFVACWVLSGIRTQKGGYQWLWIFLPLLPQVYGNLGMIWKDIGMALALFMAFAMYWAWEETLRKRFFVLALLFALYALLVRHNALTAIIPPAFLMALFFFTQKRFLKAIAVTAGVIVLCITIPLCFNYFACKSMTAIPARLTIIDEISVASLYAKKNLFFNTIKFSEVPLSALPSYPIEKGWDFYKVKVNEKDLVRNLLNVITHYPVEWIRGKFSLFSHFSSFPNRKKDAWAYDFVKDAPEQIRKSKLRNILMKIVNKCMDNELLMTFFLPIFWAPVGIVLFVAGLLRKDAWGLKMMLLTSSGLGYYAGFFIAIPTPDYRYFLWLNLSVLSALLVWYYAPRVLFMRVKRQADEAS